MLARGDPNYDRLHKIRPMINHLKKKFKETFYPSRHLSVDESMIPFKGRSSMKQYMPNKPIKRGFKVWVLACAETGYAVDFNVYTGKQESGAKKSFGLGENVVLSLSEDLQNKRYCIYFDNFFTSIPLLETLLEQGTFGTGTLRANRKHYAKEKLKIDKKMKPHEIDFIQQGDLSVIKWKD